MASIWANIIGGNSPRQTQRNSSEKKKEFYVVTLIKLCLITRDTYLLLKENFFVFIHYIKKVQMFLCFVFPVRSIRIEMLRFLTTTTFVILLVRFARLLFDGRRQCLFS